VPGWPRGVNFAELFDFVGVVVFSVGSVTRRHEPGRGAAMGRLLRSVVFPHKRIYLSSCKNFPRASAHASLLSTPSKCINGKREANN